MATLFRPLKHGVLKIDIKDAGLVLRGCYSVVTGRNKGAYCCVKVNGANQYIHRVIMNAGPGEFVDHINNNRLDNRRANLRIVTPSQNGMNRAHGYGKSRYRGVAWRPIEKKWQAQIKSAGKYYYLGCFESEIDAAKAFNEAAIRIHGEFGKLNIIE